MKQIHYLLILLAALLVGCSHIADDERLIYVKPDPARRAVLLEDFTGQNCLNCPKAADIIEQLQQEYGDSVVVAVGIHGGPQGFKGNATIVGLATDAGDAYYNHWGMPYQPVGLVNRQGPVDYTDWTARVREALATPAPLSLHIDATLDGRQLDISVSALATDGATSGKLQVWLLEDGITTMQQMPDGSYKADYVHHHVLRTPVNGLWGDDLTLAEGETATRQYSQTVAEGWDSTRLTVVAFVYDEGGVCQVSRKHLSSNTYGNK